jgi:hypothetical protein
MNEKQGRILDSFVMNEKPRRILDLFLVEQVRPSGGYRPAAKRLG